MVALQISNLTVGVQIPVLAPISLVDIPYQLLYNIQQYSDGVTGSTPVRDTGNIGSIPINCSIEAILIHPSTQLENEPSISNLLFGSVVEWSITQLC